MTTLPESEREEAPYAYEVPTPSGGTELAYAAWYHKYRRAPLPDGAVPLYLGRPPEPAVPEFKLDYMEAIAYCYKTLGHAQGTKGCVAFARGAEWALDQVRARKALSNPLSNPAGAQGAEPVAADGDSCTQEDKVAELMQLAMELAHVYSFVGDDSMPIAKDRLESALREALAAVPAGEPRTDGAPPRIWLQLHGDGEPDGKPVDYTDEVSWCWHKVHDHDVEYVLASAPSVPQEKS